MNNRFLTILLTISILANLTIGLIWYYNSQHSNYDNCLTEKKQLAKQVDTLTKQLHKSWNEQKYVLEVMLNSGLDFQKYMSEYSDVSRDKFIEAIRQKVVLLNIKLGEK